MIPNERMSGKCASPVHALISDIGSQMYMSDATPMVIHRTFINFTHEYRKCSETPVCTRKTIVVHRYQQNAHGSPNVRLQRHMVPDSIRKNVWKQCQNPVPVAPPWWYIDIHKLTNGHRNYSENAVCTRPTRVVNDQQNPHNHA